MNESIDLTIRKLFLEKLDNGQRASFDDENEYRLKFGDRNTFRRGSLLDNEKEDLFTRIAILEFFAIEEDLGYMSRFNSDCLDAAEKILDMENIYNFPLGNGSQCDCCGVDLNILNRSPHFLCIPCNEETDRGMPSQILEDGTSDESNFE